MVSWPMSAHVGPNLDRGSREPGSNLARKPSDENNKSMQNQTLSFHTCLFSHAPLPFRACSWPAQFVEWADWYLTDVTTFIFKRCRHIWCCLAYQSGPKLFPLAEAHRDINCIALWARAVVITASHFNVSIDLWTLSGSPHPCFTISKAVEVHISA